ncbi:hypothetical protein Q4E40_02695 [Pontibacter sp. BT731]|uniref:hypothetical protein n=1 Tax=Pontibacter coccineus TaxID=3063328 RepID=UPI0026E34E5F|nr:hypothetical protein [Pontibacter sp. BT731]MDO6389021.1 hypothetical protein [Pontibacter sp. BT731]
MIYTIKKGRHYSTNWVGMLWRLVRGWREFPQHKARVTFDDNCLTPSQDADDINKLFGLSHGLDHHKESARFGWRAKGDRIEILTYVYKGGKRYYEPLIEVVPFEDVYLELCRTKEGWKFTASGYGFTIEQKTVQTLAGFPLFYKRLYPYFGGTYPAPETMKIKIEWL